MPNTLPSLANISIFPEANLGPLPALFLPSAMLTYADGQAIDQLLTLPRLGVVRVGLDVELAQGLPLDGQVPMVRQLQERGAAVVIGFVGSSGGMTVQQVHERAYEAVRAFGAGCLYEFWNEPDNGPEFWQGGQRELFELYRAFVMGARSAEHSARVGGLAFGNNYTTWIGAFLEYVRGLGVPLDFLSWHNFQVEPTAGWERPAAVPLAVPHLVTEWARWGTWPHWLDPSRDTEQGAAYLIAALHAMEAHGILGQSIAHLQDYRSTGEAGDFGMLRRNPATPKPSWRALELLAGMAGHRVRVGPAPEGVTVLAAQEGSSLRVLVCRYAQGVQVVRIDPRQGVLAHVMRSISRAPVEGRGDGAAVLLGPYDVVRIDFDGLTRV